jgi:hypothetical protein
LRDVAHWHDSDLSNDRLLRIAHRASASWSLGITAQLYDVRRDQQLAGRAGQPDGSPFFAP